MTALATKRVRGWRLWRSVCKVLLLPAAACVVTLLAAEMMVAAFGCREVESARVRKDVACGLRGYAALLQC